MRVFLSHSTKDAAFVEKLAAAAQHREALGSFVRRVEWLPMAVVVAADRLKHQYNPLDQAAFALRLEALRNRVHDVPALFECAIAAQREQERSLLFAAAVCAPQSFWLPLAVEIAGLNEAQGKDSRDRLVNASLLRVQDRDRQRFQLHALLREQLRRGTSAQDGLATLDILRQRHVAALERLFQGWEAKWEWKKYVKCLVELMPALEFLTADGAIERMSSLADYGFQAAYRLGELEAAMRFLEFEENIWAKRVEDEAKWKRQRIYGNQALILKAWGRLDEALALHKKEEALCLELGYRDGLQASYGNQAGILYTWGRLDEALALHKKEEALCLERGNKDGLQRCYGNQALILMEWKRYDEATQLLQKSEALCLELSLRRDLGYSYWQWGSVAQAQGDLGTAKAKFQAALGIFTSLRMPRERDGVQADLEELA